MDATSSYLYGHAMRAAAHFAPGTQASITLRHHGTILRAASSDERSARCDQVEALRGDGPCIAALDQRHPVVVDDIDALDRWADWRVQAAAEGFTGAVAMPAPVVPGIDVALNLYSGSTGPWGERALRDADESARRIAHAISLRVHLSGAPTPSVEPVPTSPSVVEEAVGAVMHCNGCTAQEAMHILVSASRHRNVGLEEVAGTVLQALNGVAADTSARLGRSGREAAGGGR
jgi:hypothetical protein